MGIYPLRLRAATTSSRMECSDASIKDLALPGTECPKDRQREEGVVCSLLSAGSWRSFPPHRCHSHSLDINKKPH